MVPEAVSHVSHIFFPFDVPLKGSQKNSFERAERRSQIQTQLTGGVSDNFFIKTNTRPRLCHTQLPNPNDDFCWIKTPPSKQQRLRNMKTRPQERGSRGASTSKIRPVLKLKEMLIMKQDQAQPQLKAATPDLRCG